MTDSIDAAGRDKKLVQEALALAQKQVDACTRDIAAAKEELAGMTAQREAGGRLSRQVPEGAGRSAGGH